MYEEALPALASGWLIPKYGGITPLGSQEKAFLDWYKRISQEAGLSPNPDDPQHQYDYRGYWLANQAGLASRGYDPGSGEIHFPSTYKLPGHPTYSKQFDWRQ